MPAPGKPACPFWRPGWCCCWPPNAAGCSARVCFVNYAGLGVPVIGAGVLSPWTGLEAATTAAAIVIAGGCALLIPLVIRQRA